MLFLRYMVHDRCNGYFSFWAISKKIKKKTPRDVIIWHKCTKNYHHIVYCSWDMARDGCNWYFPFWATFCTFTPLTCLKNQNSKKMKKTPWRYHYFLRKCTKNHDHMVYCSWDIARDRCNCYFSFWAKNQNFTNIKKGLEISSFYTCVPKIMIRWCVVPEIWCTTDRWTDWRTDRWADWQTDRWTDRESET